MRLCDNAIIRPVKKNLLKDSEQKALEIYIQKLKAVYGSRFVLAKLFGSAVRGERWTESDIDILILIADLTWEEKRRVWDEATLLNIEWDILLSPLVMTPPEFQELHNRERRIALDVEQEGIEL